MQFRFPTGLSAEEYVQQEVWKYINISECPIHPGQDCKLTRHGTYERVVPPGTKIPRFLCHTETITCSLLADCFSSRLSGTLIDVETVVFMVEEAARVRAPQSGDWLLNGIISLCSLDIATVADELNVDQRLFDLASDFKWLKRRVDYVRNILTAMIMLFPGLFKDCTPSITSFRLVLGDAPIFNQLRDIAETKLHEIPEPLGLNPRFQRPHDMTWKPP